MLTTIFMTCLGFPKIPRQLLEQLTLLSIYKLTHSIHFHFQHVIPLPFHNISLDNYIHTLPVNHTIPHFVLLYILSSIFNDKRLFTYAETWVAPQVVCVLYCCVNPRLKAKAIGLGHSRLQPRLSKWIPKVRGILWTRQSVANVWSGPLHD